MGASYPNRGRGGKMVLREPDKAEVRRIALPRTPVDRPLVPSQEWSIARCPGPRSGLYLGYSGEHERRRQGPRTGLRTRRPGRFREADDEEVPEHRGGGGR